MATTKIEYNGSKSLHTSSPITKANLHRNPREWRSCYWAFQNSENSDKVQFYPKKKKMVAGVCGYQEATNRLNEQMVRQISFFSLFISICRNIKIKMKILSNLSLFLSYLFEHVDEGLIKKKWKIQACMRRFSIRKKRTKWCIVVRWKSPTSTFEDSRKQVYSPRRRFQDNFFFFSPSFTKTLSWKESSLISHIYFFFSLCVINLLNERLQTNSVKDN